MLATSSMPDQRGSLVTVTALAGFAAVTAYIVWALPGLGACGGDGGAPYAREGTWLASLCGLRATWTPLLLLGPPLLVVAGGIVGRVCRRRWPAPAGCLAAAAWILVPFVLLWIADGPGQRY